jgi:hypothetical protein
MIAEARFNEREALQLLLVKALEEEQPAAFGPDTLAGAALAAQNEESDAVLLEKRAAALFFHLPKPLKRLDWIALLPENWLAPSLLLAFLAGIASNYIGSAGQIHVVYNPTVLLLLWNLGVYAVLLWCRLFRAKASRSVKTTSDLPGDATESVRIPDEYEEHVRGREPLVTRGARYLVPGLWAGCNRWYLGFQARRAGLKNAGRVLGNFFEQYFRVARPVFIARAEFFLHLCAIGLTLGAIAGIYFRGLFFEYRAVWRSTFITDPSVVGVLLNTFLLPASLILDGAPISSASIENLLKPAGDAAAPWLHKLALSAFLFVCVPRVILASLAAKRARSAAGRIEIDLAKPYFAETIRRVRESHRDRLREEATIEIRAQIAKLAESLGVCVRDRFFDCHVLPTVIAFRNAGGRIDELELEIQRQAASFQPELLHYLSVANMDFQRTLEERLRKILGRRIFEERLTIGEASVSKPEAFGTTLTGSVAGVFADSIGIGVTAAVSAGVATISGGMGKSLGIAILSSLLGTSGPIGLLLGALLGLVAGGAAYWLGKDRLTGTVKQWKIPAGLLKAALRDSQLQETREKVYETVKSEVQQKLEPSTFEITNQLVAGLSAHPVGGNIVGGKKS